MYGSPSVLIKISESICGAFLALSHPHIGPADPHTHSVRRVSLGGFIIRSSSRSFPFLRNLSVISVDGQPHSPTLDSSELVSSGSRLCLGISVIVGKVMDRACHDA